MKRPERAAQIWPLLTFCAAHRLTVTYEILGRHIGVPRQGLGQLLEPIQSICLLRRWPPLTSLVVSEKSGSLGEGFIAAADVPSAQASVFAHPWCEATPPSSKELDEAAAKLPTNGKQLSLLAIEASTVAYAVPSPSAVATRVFKSDEDGYLAWIHSNPDGFVVNLDEPLRTPQYPMVHLATHKLVSSATPGNYTTGRYFKVCSLDLAALEKWALDQSGRELTRCSVCMR